MKEKNLHFDIIMFLVLFFLDLKFVVVFMIPKTRQHLHFFKFTPISLQLNFTDELVTWLGQTRSLV